MAGLLTSRQKEELNRSILDYLMASGLTQSFETLRQEAGQEDFQYDPKDKLAGLLTKKWTSVVRLQKKIMELEARNAQLQEELSTRGSLPASTRSSADWVPRGPPRHTLTGHRMQITRVAFHPVFSSLATASEDSDIKIWDWETGEFERTLKGHTKGVQDVDFDSKGNRLVSSSSDFTLKLWDVNNEFKNMRTLHGHNHTVSSVRFMPGDEHVVSASRDQTIRIWEVATGYCIRTLSGHAEWVREAVPSLDGRLIASASNDQSARLWDVASGESKMELRGHEHVVETAVFAPAAAHDAIRELAGLPPPPTKEARANQVFVATGSRDKTIKLWDGSSGQCLKTLIGHDNWIRALVFHPSGKFLLSASDDKTVRVWDLKLGRCTKTIDAHAHFVTCMAWGRMGATAQPNSTTPDKANGAAPAASRPVNVIATGSVDLTVNIWLP